MSRTLLIHVLFACLALAGGCAFGYSVFSKSVEAQFYKNTIDFSKKLEPFGEKVGLPEPYLNVLQYHSVRTGTFVPVSFHPPVHGKMIGVDGENRQVILFENGKARAKFFLLNIPDATDFCPGNYRVSAKEALHQSLFTGVTLPWTVAVNTSPRAALFFHGQATTTLSSLHSLELATADAAVLYRFADLKNLVTITGAANAHCSFSNTTNSKNSAVLSFPLQKLSAYAYRIEDIDTHTVLAEHNATLPLPIASVSKLMTALVAEKKYKALTLTQVSKRAASTFGAAGALYAGEKLRVLDLVHDALLESSNAAAEALSEVGDRAAFLASMNSIAAALGMTATHYEDPSGLTAKNVSSARDLTRLLMYLVEHANSLLAITKKTAWQDSLDGAVWKNHNHLVTSANTYYLGGKTGYTPEAGQTSVALFRFPTDEFNTHRIAITILRSYDRDLDMSRILSALHTTFGYVTESAPQSANLATARLFANAKATSTPIAELVAVGNIDFGEDIPPAQLLSDAYYLKSGTATIADLEALPSALGFAPVSANPHSVLPSVLHYLREEGFTDVVLGNAHAGDWGRSGIARALDMTTAEHLHALGVGADMTGAEQVRVVQGDGVRFGLLATALDAPGWLENNNFLPTVLSAREQNIPAIIRQAKKSVDHVIVTIHYNESVAQEKVSTLAQSYIDAGASAVLGFGLRQALPIVRYKNGVIVESLGDYYNVRAQGVPSQGVALELIFSREALQAINAEHITLNNEGKIELVSEDN